MIRLKLFKKSMKEESFLFACLRALKVLSLKVPRFVRSIPCILISLRKKKVVKEINGCKMNLYLSDKGIARDLFIYSKRENMSTDLIKTSGIIKPGDVVLDLGANIGYYALLESAIVGPDGKIFAVEPSPLNYRVLKENINLNGCTNIETFSIAMGDYNGKARMFVSNRSNWSRLVEKNLEDQIDETVMVDISTVDEFLKGRLRPSLIRMDVEGYEINILRGMKQTLKNDRLSIFVEFHPTLMSEQECTESFDILEENGFEVKYCLLNPSLEQNFFARFAYKNLGEYDDYTGKFLNMTLAEAREWLHTHKFMRLPHFLFHKGM